jgi:hypothetical protein
MKIEHCDFCDNVMEMLKNHSIYIKKVEIVTGPNVLVNRNLAFCNSYCLKNYITQIGL